LPALTAWAASEPAALIARCTALARALVAVRASSSFNHITSIIALTACAIIILIIIIIMIICAWPIDWPIDCPSAVGATLLQTRASCMFLN
jgi:hypothetical protein